MNDEGNEEQKVQDEEGKEENFVVLKRY